MALATTVALTAGCPGDDGGGPDGGPDGGGGGGPLTVSGRVTYDFVPATYSPATGTGTLEFAKATERPARNVKVQAMQGTTVLTSTTTDEQGNYQLSFTLGATGTASIVALAQTTTPSIQIGDNTAGGAIWAISDSVSAGTTVKNLHATHGWTGSGFDATKRTAAPFAILDTMYTASKAFMAVRPVNFPPLKVNWSPNNVPETGVKSQGFIGTSHYSFQEKQIYVLGKVNVDTDEFDTHVIAHEWGHYFEDNLSRSDSPGGPHGPGDKLDPRIAFGEGYGNAIAAMLLPESIYADTNWGGSGGTLTAFGFDAETAPASTDDLVPGPFSEMSVLRVLYDIYDSGTNEAYDQVGVGLGPIYDVLVGGEKTTEALTTIGSFISVLKAQPGVNAAAVDTLLAHYQLGAITSPFGDGDSQLRAMYTDVTSFPYSTSGFTFGGGFEYNTWEQNQYFVFTGNGSSITVTANSNSDVAIGAYLKGVLVRQSDNNTSGTESFTFTSQPNAKYVLVLTGFEKQVKSEYAVSLSIKSP
ncbi:MAG: hypothetical protein ACJ8AT_19795 [Hyalangium sp.]